MLSVVTYLMEIHSDPVSFVLGMLVCVAVIFLVVNFEEMFGRGMKVYDADFPDAYALCSTNEIVSDESGHRKVVVHMVLG